MKKRTIVWSCVGLFAAVTAWSGLSEADLRTALAKWMTGDRVIQNPFVELVNWVNSESVVVTDTYSSLGAVPATGRTVGAVVVTRGLATASDGGGSVYAYDPTSAAGTNLYTSRAASGGGRYLAIRPVQLRAAVDWDPPSCASNAAISTNISVVGAAVGDQVLVSHTGIGNQPDCLLSGKATTDVVFVTFKNNSGAAIDAGTGSVRVLVFKY